VRSDEYVLEVNKLSFSYPAYGARREELFSGLSFVLRKGEFMLVSGPPESGKSSLARILIGLIPRYTGGELSGTIRCMGRKLEEITPSEMLPLAGLVFQDPHEQIITSRCDTEVAFPLETLGIEPREMERRIADALDFFGLTSYANIDTAALSGGEKKKLLLAVQYALDPQVWILDETPEELDSATRRRLFTYLRKRGKSVLLFSAKFEASYQQSGATVALLRRGSLRFGSAAPGAALFEEAREAGLVPGLLPAGAERSRPASGKAAAGADAAPLLTAERLRFSYPGGAFRLAVDYVDIRPGEILALVGANGCGKSTLGRILCGLTEPAEGNITLRDGEETRSLSGEERTRRIAYMFQNPDYQIFLPTVQAELAFGLEQAGTPQEDIEELTADAIDRFDLPAGEFPPTLLSYGARKRLQAATYYLLERKVYILDEVDSGLTYANVVHIIDNLLRDDAALLLITHDAFLASTLCDRVVLMERGAVREVISADDYRRQNELQEEGP